MTFEQGRRYLARYVGLDSDGNRIYVSGCHASGLPSGFRGLSLYAGLDADGNKIYLGPSEDDFAAGKRHLALFVGLDADGNKVYVTAPCGGCAPIEDDFDRDDSSDLGDSWTETDWAIDTDAAATSTSDAAAIHTEESPDEYGVVRLAFRGTNYGDEIKLILNWEDADNHVYFLFKLAASSGGAATMELWEVVDGTPNMLTSGSTATGNGEPNEWHTLQLCRRKVPYGSGQTLQAGRKIAPLQFEWLTPITTGDWTTELLGTEFGFSTGDITSSVEVDDFYFVKQSLTEGETLEKCPSCQVCILYADDFDDNELSEDWEIVRGDWVESGGIITGSSLAAYDRIRNPVGVGTRVRVDVSATGEGDQLGFVHWHSGTSSGDEFSAIMVRFSSSGGWIRKANFPDGCATDPDDVEWFGPEIPISASPGSWHELSMCTTGGDSNGGIYWDGRLVINRGPATPISWFAPALGLVAGPHTGTLKFNDWRVENTTGGECRCRACIRTDFSDPFDYKKGLWSRWNDETEGLTPDTVDEYYDLAGGRMVANKYVNALGVILPAHGTSSPAYNIVCVDSDFFRSTGWTSDAQIAVEATIYPDRGSDYDVDTGIGIAFRQRLGVVLNAGTSYFFASERYNVPGAPASARDGWIFGSGTSDVQYINTPAPAAGDVIKMVAERVTSTTAEIRCYVNGVLVHTTPSAVSFVTSSLGLPIVGTGTYLVLTASGFAASVQPPTGLAWDNFRVWYGAPGVGPLSINVNRDEPSFDPAPASKRGGCCN